MLRAHGRQHRLGHRDHADHVELQDPGELVKVELVEAVMQAHPGVVDQPVDAAVPLQCRLDQRGDVLAVGDIGADGERAAEFGGQRVETAAPPGGQHRMRARLVQ